MKHIIWSNMNYITDEELAFYREDYPDAKYMADDELAIIIYTDIQDNLGDERMNLDVELSNDIIAIADLGLWNGKTFGYKILGTNINNCLYTNCNSAEWYVDGYGNLRMTGVHHDGTNTMLYRMFKPEISDNQIDYFLNAIYENKLTSSMVSKYTLRLGDYIGDVYGWKFAKRVDIA